jgi:hypothetical protein
MSLNEPEQASSRDITVEHEPHGTDAWTASSLFSTAACAVAAFTFAVAALLGQNGVTVGISTMFESGIGLGGDAFYVSWGVATAVQVVVVLLLARRALVATGRWEATLARGAVLVAGVALLAAALVVVGGMLNEGGPGF